MTSDETPADQHFNSGIGAVEGADPNVPDHEHTRSLSRRGFLGGSLAVGAALAVGGTLTEEGLSAQSAQAATSTVPSVGLPTTIDPEQLRLVFGANPAREVTVSFSAPGTVPLPAPTLAYSTHPITRENPGRIVKLPAPTPLNQKAVRTGPVATSFTDGTSGFTTYNYHVPLTDLEPGTSYYYEVSNGAQTPAVAGASFTTAREGRFPYRFTSFGDLGTPDGDLSASGQTLTVEASDTSYYTVGAIEQPGDGGPAPLFHLLNGDLCYANLAPGNAPAVWRDFGVNVGRSAAHRPWMPALGNHEVELGATALSGAPSTSAYWNGPYGHGHYLSRFVLPDNDMVNHDGNHLQGSFYSFQVGTVFFISLDADDVTFQGNQISEVATSTYDSGLTIPAGTVDSVYQYTGTLVAGDNDSLVPGGAAPNRQTQWLEAELRRARANDGVELIVVFMHHCPLSANTSGNGTDLGIRKTWLPLFDEYEVDLVLSGHEHVFERSFPVRGYDHGAYGTVTTAFSDARGSYAVGDRFNTRRPAVVKNTTATVDGKQVVDTARGTVYYILGGGGALSTYGYTTDAATGIRQANVWSTVNGRDAVEDATWSDSVDSGDAHGYAIFDVDPGARRGETTITVKWFQLPTVDEGAAPAFDPTPYSTATYGRSAGWKRA